ncbi:MAG: class II aldolase/adducin family protein [Firmicutes bacterium]|nr:class II aldolase/adducin family protein [Bacillota bacterium]
MLGTLRAEVLHTARSLRDLGLVSLAGGTVCARDRETGLVAITPSGVDYFEITSPDGICVVDLDMRLVDGRYKQSIATDMFTRILKARPDVGAVIHTHSPFATAFSCCDEPLPVLTTTHANIAGGPVPVVVPLHPGAHTGDYLDNIVTTMGTGYAVNLSHHGPVVAGRDLEHCLAVAITVEDTARIAAIARRLGGATPLDAAQTRIAFEYYNTKYGQR